MEYLDKDSLILSRVMFHPILKLLDDTYCITQILIVYNQPSSKNLI